MLELLKQPKFSPRSGEKMVEALVYTLTSIEKVDKIILYVEGDILTK